MGLFSNGLHFGYLSENMLDVSCMVLIAYLISKAVTRQFVDEHVIIFNPSNSDLGKETS